MQKQINEQVGTILLFHHLNPQELENFHKETSIRCSCGAIIEYPAWENWPNHIMEIYDELEKRTNNSTSNI